MTDPRAFTVPLPTLGGKQLWGDEFVHRRYRIQRNTITGGHRLLDPRNLRLAGGSYEACRRAFDDLATRRDLSRPTGEVVVLLHGIFRAKESWTPMVRGLEAAGLEAEPVNYPSTRAGLEAHADQVERLLDRLRGAHTVSFVTHSMGGLVARELLARDAPWRSRLQVNRLVMIATPNRGAEMADRLLPLWSFRQLAGPAAAQLGTAWGPRVPLPTVPFGVIAGVRGDGRGFNPLLPGEDDLTVSLASTHLDGAEDTLVVRAVHTFILQAPAVVQATVRYLKTGRFSA
jgi:pimeloyl-ACP methyl ester carboxylesterase